MASIEVFDLKGKSAGKHELHEKLVEAQTSPTSVHRAVVAEEANKRQGTQSAKTRSDVRGGGKKPYKQKKTGNARQGTIRAPHYTHGGMALAVKPRDYEKQVNRKERRASILTAFASQNAAGNVKVIKELAFKESKTKQAHDVLKALDLDKTRRVLLILPQYDESTYKSFRNLPNVEVRTAPARQSENDEVKSQGFSVRDLMVAHKVVVTVEALKQIEEVWAK